VECIAIQRHVLLMLNVCLHHAFKEFALGVIMPMMDIIAMHLLALLILAVNQELVCNNCALCATTE
jgi:hypothetical protein